MTAQVLAIFFVWFTITSFMTALCALVGDGIDNWRGIRSALLYVLFLEIGVALIVLSFAVLGFVFK